MPRETYTAMVRRQMAERGVVPLAQMRMAVNDLRYDGLAIYSFANYEIVSLKNIEDVVVPQEMVDDMFLDVFEPPPTDPPGT